MITCLFELLLDNRHYIEYLMPALFDVIKCKLLDVFSMATIPDVVQMDLKRSTMHCGWPYVIHTVIICRSTHSVVKTVLGDDVRLA